jgi:NADH:ubiquinone oxidoreductase subunit 5 (subunit L)/multisubunit Na+/H+ antiporter MnhA subunit
MLWAVFFGVYNREAHEAHGIMLHPLWPLAIGSAIAGYFGPHQEGAWPIMIGSALVSIAGLYLGQKIRLPELLKVFFARKWFINDTYEMVLVKTAAGRGSATLNWIDRNIIDLLPRASAFFTSTASLISGWFDGAIVDGLVKVTAALFSLASYPLRLAQTGRTHNYALVIVITVAISFGWYWLQ